jgi:hypothetical protein
MMLSLIAGWSFGQRSTSRDRSGSVRAISSFGAPNSAPSVSGIRAFDSASGVCSNPLGAVENQRSSIKDQNYISENRSTIAKRFHIFDF